MKIKKLLQGIRECRREYAKETDTLAIELSAIDPKRLTSEQLTLYKSIAALIAADDGILVDLAALGRETREALNIPRPEQGLICAELSSEFQEILNRLARQDGLQKPRDGPARAGAGEEG